MSIEYKCIRCYKAGKQSVFDKLLREYNERSDEIETGDLEGTAVLNFIEKVFYDQGFSYKQMMRTADDIKRRRAVT